jgi:hypothetical protein
MLVWDLGQCAAMVDSDHRASASRGWRPTMKKSLNEEDFPLFTHRRCPIGERVVCFFFLPPK